MSADHKRSPRPLAGMPLDNDDIAFEDDVAAGTGAPPLRDARPARPAEALSPLIAALRRMPGALAEGHVYVIGIESFRDRAGAGWVHCRARVHEGIATILKETLDPHDRCLPAGEDAFVIAFAGPEPAHAAMKAARIAKRIKDRLFGGMSAEPSVRMLGADLIRSVHGRDRPAAPVRAAASRRQIAPLSPTGALNYIFTPVWDAARKTLSSCVCTPRQRQESGIERYGMELLSAGADEIERARFHAQTLSFALETARNLPAGEDPPFISVSCDYQALSSPKGRDIYFKACRNIPDPLKKRMLLRLTGVDQSIPVIPLTERVGALKPYFRTVTLRLHSLDQTVGRFAFMGLHAVSAALNTQRAVDWAQLAAAIRNAKGARLQFSFSHVPDFPTAQKLVSLGATYLSGAFLGTGFDAPQPMVRCTLADLARRSQL